MTVKTNSYYRHYKGGLYHVLLIAKDEETQEQRVIYKGIDGKIWDRKLSVWIENVNGQPRFTKVKNQRQAHLEYMVARAKFNKIEHQQ